MNFRYHQQGLMGEADDMNLTDAMAAILAEIGKPLSSRELADAVWESFEHFRYAPAHVSSTHYSNLQDALRAAVATTAATSIKFSLDRSGPVVLVSLAYIADVWSRDELAAAVEAYLQMRELSMAGTSFVKMSYYRSLSEKLGRTPASYEFRMQNISAVLSAQGRYWIPGLLPAKNVGTKVFRTIEVLLSELEGREFEALTAPTPGEIDGVPPVGELLPSLRTSRMWRFVRDPRVRDWVLRNARGICENCDQPAPFESMAGPFLEVHHLRRLADGGADTITNAVALCPNCHRRFHYALDASQLLNFMFDKIVRLERHGFQRANKRL